MTLTEIREALVDVLHDVGFPVSSTLPGRFTPPIGVLVPGSPYVQGGATFGSFEVRFDLVVIAGSGDNASVAHRLDEAIASSVTAVSQGAGFALQNIEQPSLFKHGNTEYLACVITVSTTQHVEG